MASSAIVSWSAYYEKQDTTPRPTLVSALRKFEQEGIEPGLAVDLGCGAGRDTAHLLKEGWRVHAMDSDPYAESYLIKKIEATAQERLTYLQSTYSSFQPPENVRLVNASYALPFANPDTFPALMEKILGCIEKGGRFSGQFFGKEDSWSQEASMVFHTREEVEAFFEGLQIEFYEEEQVDRPSVSSGVKHWHIHHIVARKA